MLVQVNEAVPNTFIETTKKSTATIDVSRASWMMTDMRKWTPEAVACGIAPHCETFSNFRITGSKPFF